MFIVVTLLCGLTLAGCSSDASRAGRISAKSRSFEVQYVSRVRDIPSDAKELRLWIPLPRDNLHQRITALKVEAPLRHEITVEKAYGNRMVFFSVPNPPPHFEVTVRFRVHRFENSARYGRATNAQMKAAALQPSKLVPLSARIQKKADGIAAGKTDRVERARAVYEHVIERMAYDKTGTGWGRGDFWHASDVGRGNCTDYHAYFIGLCRNIGIPAYFQIGLSVPARPAEGKTGGYHCWAYFWEGSHWIPVDVSEADKRPEMKQYFFGNHCENRVAFSVGRDIVLEPPQKGDPLNFFVYPYAEVDGKPHKDITKRSHYRNLAGEEAP